MTNNNTKNANIHRNTEEEKFGEKKLNDLQREYSTVEKNCIDLRTMP